jgi:hypothetical protein
MYKIIESKNRFYIKENNNDLTIADGKFIFYDLESLFKSLYNGKITRSVNTFNNLNLVNYEIHYILNDISPEKIIEQFPEFLIL